MNPQDAGGTPAVIPSNDWWSTAVNAVSNYQMAKLKLIPAQGGQLSSNAANIPIGQQGTNPQAASVPGGTLQGMGAGLSLEARSMVLLVVGALALVLMFGLPRR